MTSPNVSIAQTLEEGFTLTEDASRMIKYAQDKFIIGSYAYLTKNGHEEASDDIGSDFHRGPWRIDKLGAYHDKAYMSLFNPTEPSWHIASYIEDDTDIQDWLTADEYFIERAKTRIWEANLYGARNAQFLNKKVDTEDNAQAAQLDKWLEKPHLWVPEIGEEIQILRSAQSSFAKGYHHLTHQPYVKCIVLDIDDMDLPHSFWNPHGLPSLYVKPVQTNDDIGPTRGINPKLCYPQYEN